MSGNLRGGSFKDHAFNGSEAKDVRDTKHLDTMAKENPDHISGTNEQKEYDSGSTKFGKLGARGQA